MIHSTHNHSTGSDGKLTPEQVILKAIDLGWDYVYFTDHYFMPEETKIDAGGKFSFFNENYIKEIKPLQKKYSNKIKIYFGVEMGWLEEYPGWIKNEINKHEFDYVIGSVHDLKIEEKYTYIDSGVENFRDNAKKFGGVKFFVKEYFNQMKLMIQSGLYDCVGHLDAIKGSNKNNEFFSETEDWYKKEVLKVLDLIKKHNIVMEINASGIRKCNEQFPSLWIIKEARKRDIPITLGLDAHWEKHYTNNDMDKITEIAKQAGYNEAVRFEKRKKIKEQL
ncbi:MAG: histidinol-phosphatase [Candidatus Pacearchaeota archaeon]|jgi:histidinol-phosphatase (PHP family)